LHVQFGIIDYDSEVSSFLKTSGEHANQINRLEEYMQSERGEKEVLKYCALDSIYEYRLAMWQRKHMAGTQGLTEVSPINSDFPNAYHLLHNGVLALGKAERQGIRVDVEYCERMVHRLEKKVERLEKKIFSSNFYKRWQHVSKGKVNLNSGDQLAYYLYNVKKLTPAKFTDSGKGSTDEEALKMLKIPELNWMIERSKLLKSKDTYLGGFLKEQVNGVLHPFFNLHLAKTYRSSSQNPNFQNIPKRDKKTMQLIRKALFPRPGHQLLEMDYSGIEVAIAACYHKDPTMIEYIENPDNDMHGDMAAQIFLVDDFDKHDPEHSFLRKATKNGFVFPQFYGDYFKNNAESLCGDWLGLPQGKWKKGMGMEFAGGHISDHLIAKGIKEFGTIKRNGNKTIITGFLKHIRDIEEDFWTKRFPVYAKWKEKHYERYLENGYTSLYTGFVNKGIMGKNDAINYPIQGSAFHCLLWSFHKITEELEKREMDSKLIGQIHDAIVVDVHPDELEEVHEIIIDIGTRQLKDHWKWINVPLEIEAELCPVDASWAEKQDWNPADDIPF
jgi:DNA polymerase-1